MAHFEFSSVIEAPRPEVFKYASDIENLPEIMESHCRIELTTPPSRLAKGVEYEIRVTRIGVSLLWGVVVEDFVEGEFLRNRQSHGPFTLWVHTQKFEDHGQGTLMTDLIEYDVPFGLLGKLADDIFIRRDLNQVFKQRHDKIAQHFARALKKDGS